jgi:predicted nucleic acid-binding protein
MGLRLAVAAIVYLDTNVFIRAFEFVGAEAEPVRQLLTILEEHPRAAVTSELSLAELLAPPKRENEFPLARKVALYGNLLIWSGLIDLWPIRRNILIGTAILRQNWSYKLADAVHVVSALDASCSFFMSGDADTRRLPPGLQRVPANRSGVDLVLESLRA